ncbi:MAG: AP2 domain-containing protein [Patescibacteria group bacterium]
MSKTKTYNTWKQMKKRCTNSNFPGFKDYGGRGIKVCKRWQIFKNFYKDMGDHPDGLWIDRTNNNGNYNPKNCKWVTPKENLNNRRKVLFHTKKRANTTSKYIGVVFLKRTDRWRAYVKENGKSKILGQFKTEEEAYTVRQAWEKSLSK